MCVCACVVCVGGGLRPLTSAAAGLRRKEWALATADSTMQQENSAIWTQSQRQIRLECPKLAIKASGQVLDSLSGPDKNVYVDRQRLA